MKNVCAKMVPRVLTKKLIERQKELLQELNAGPKIKFKNDYDEIQNFQCDTETK